MSYLPIDPDFVREEFPFYWLARVHAAYEMEMERALKPVNIDIPTWRVLLILEQQGACSVSEVALHAVAKLSTVTKLVYRMKEAGYVETSMLPEDNRVTMVTITATGHQAIERGRLATSSIFTRTFDGLSAVQVRRLNDTMRHMLDRLSPRHGEAAAGRAPRKVRSKAAQDVSEN